MLALLAQWVPAIVHAIQTGRETIATLHNDFTAATPDLTPDQRAAAWAAIIQHDEVKAAIHHAAAGEDAQGNPLPPANAQVGAQLRAMAPIPSFDPAPAPAALQGDNEADVTEPVVTAGDIADEAPAEPDGRPSADRHTKIVVPHTNVP